MTLQEQLCEKMRVEQSAYCLWLTAQPPEEILHHTYEYSVREDIILATEECYRQPHSGFRSAEDWHTLGFRAHRPRW